MWPPSGEQFWREVLSLMRFSEGGLTLEALFELDLVDYGDLVAAAESLDKDIAKAMKGK